MAKPSPATEKGTVPKRPLNADVRPRECLTPKEVEKIIATALSDLGFDVDIGPLFQTPEEAARQAIENDVHIVGASSLAAGHLTLVPELRAALDAHGRQDVMIVVGGVVPPQDHDAVRAAGAAAIFGPGTVIPDAAAKLLDALEAAAEST